MRYGCQSKVAKIQSILLKHPNDAFLNQEVIDSQWKDLNYTEKPDFHQCIKDYEFFVGLLKNEIPDLFFLPANKSTGLDSIYTHDPVLVTNKGALLLNMGKTQRNGEPSAIAEYLREIDIPVVGSISGPGTVEGGDTIWLDKGKTLAVARSYRTNAEGIRQLRDLTSDIVDDFITVPLPHWTGPDEVLHLMSIISPIDEDLALVYSRLMPLDFREILINKGMQLIEVPDSEYESMACNVLTVSPRKCILLEGNPITKSLLERNGVTVWEYPGGEISLKGAGGPTCLSRPLLRMA